MRRSRSSGDLPQYQLSGDPTNAANADALKHDRGNYNVLGMASGYTVDVNNDSHDDWDRLTTYRYDYFGFGGILKTAREWGDSDKGYHPGTTTTTFDTHGNAIKIENPNGDPKRQTLTLNAENEIIRKDVVTKDDDAKYQNYYYVNGNPIGDKGTLSLVYTDYNYTPISSRYPSSSPSQYVVQRDGETLQGKPLERGASASSACASRPNVQTTYSATRTEFKSTSVQSIPSQFRHILVR